MWRARVARPGPGATAAALISLITWNPAGCAAPGHTAGCMVVQPCEYSSQRGRALAIPWPPCRAPVASEKLTASLAKSALRSPAQHFGGARALPFDLLRTRLFGAAAENVSQVVFAGRVFGRGLLAEEKLDFVVAYRDLAVDSRSRSRDSTISLRSPRGTCRMNPVALQRAAKIRQRHLVAFGNARDVRSSCRSSTRSCRFVGHWICSRSVIIAPVPASAARRAAAAAFLLPELLCHRLIRTATSRLVITSLLTTAVCGPPKRRMGAAAAQGAGGAAGQHGPGEPGKRSRKRVASCHSKIERPRIRAGLVEAL